MGWGEKFLRTPWRNSSQRGPRTGISSRLYTLQIKSTCASCAICCGWAFLLPSFIVGLLSIEGIPQLQCDFVSLVENFASYRRPKQEIKHRILHSTAQHPHQLWQTNPQQKRPSWMFEWYHSTRWHVSGYQEISAPGLVLNGMWGGGVHSLSPAVW